jgi:hypothetical protein
VVYRAGDDTGRTRTTGGGSHEEVISLVPSSAV